MCFCQTRCTVKPFFPRIDAPSTLFPERCTINFLNSQKMPRQILYFKPDAPHSLFLGKFFWVCSSSLRTQMDGKSFLKKCTVHFFLKNRWTVNIVFPVFLNLMHRQLLFPEKFHRLSSVQLNLIYFSVRLGPGPLRCPSLSHLPMWEAIPGPLSPPFGRLEGHRSSPLRVVTSRFLQVVDLRD